MPNQPCQGHQITSDHDEITAMARALDLEACLTVAANPAHAMECLRRAGELFRLVGSTDKATEVATTIAAWGR